MTHFTLTDENTIAGCLEIADLPNVFISEKITTYFPEDRFKVALIALDITPKQHELIAKYRYDIYTLVRYLKDEEILFFALNPASDLAQRPSRSHFEKMMLLFDFWDSGMVEYDEDFALLGMLNQHDELLRLERKYGFNLRSTSTIHFLGGSGDGSGMDSGSCYSYSGVDDLKMFKRAAMQGEVSIFGSCNGALNHAHRQLKDLYRWAKETFPASFLDGMAFDYLLGDGHFSTLQKLFGAGRVKDEIHKIAGLSTLEASNRHLLLRGFFKNGFLNAQEIKKIDSKTAASKIGEIVLALGPLGLYLFHHYREARRKSRTQKLLRKFLPLKTRHRVVYFTDTLHEINGVARTSQKILSLIRERQYDITFATAYPKQSSEEARRNFEPLMSFNLPDYDEIPVHIPDFMEVLEFCKQENFDVIYAATPGVLGIYAFLIAQILSKPFVTTFHTDFPGYVGRYSGEAGLETMTWQLFAMMFNRAERILSPSKVYRKILASNGVKKSRIEVFSRGVNTEKFSPHFRRSDFWVEFDPYYKGEMIVLFVGRFAKEKNIDTFLQTARLLESREDVKFAIVGDGPYRQEVDLEAHRNVIFTGYLEGERLACAYASGDVFLFPSQTETFGNVVLEAQACGLAVIVSGEGAVRENMEHARTGYVIEENNPFEYAKRVIELMEHRERLKSMQKSALHYAHQRNEKALLETMVETFCLKTPSRRGGEV